MTHFRILIQRVDLEEGQPEHVTDLDQIDVAAPDARSLQKETALDQLEAQTLASGHEVMRHLLTRQWERVDQQLSENYRELFSPLPDPGGRSRSDQSGQPGGDPASAPAMARKRKRRSPPAGQ
jgi:hypothetical protein